MRIMSINCPAQYLSPKKDTCRKPGGYYYLHKILLWPGLCCEAVSMEGINAVMATVIPELIGMSGLRNSHTDLGDVSVWLEVKATGVDVATKRE